MPHVPIKVVSDGTILFPDDGFTCLTFNKPYTVEKDSYGLYIRCEDGNHYLDGQIEGDVYIGLSLTAWPPLQINRRSRS